MSTKKYKSKHFDKLEKLLDFCESQFQPQLFNKKKVIDSKTYPKFLAIGPKRKGKSTLGNLLLEKSLSFRDNTNTDFNFYDENGCATERFEIKENNKESWENGSYKVEYKRTDTLAYIDTEGFEVNYESAENFEFQLNGVFNELTNSLENYLNGLVFVVSPIENSFSFNDFSIEIQAKVLSSFLQTNLKNHVKVLINKGKLHTSKTNSPIILDSNDKIKLPEFKIIVSDVSLKDQVQINTKVYQKNKISRKLSLSQIHEENVGSDKSVHTPKDKYIEYFKKSLMKQLQKILDFDNIICIQTIIESIITNNNFYFIKTKLDDNGNSIPYSSDDSSELYRLLDDIISSEPIFLEDSKMFCPIVRTIKEVDDIINYFELKSNELNNFIIKCKDIFFTISKQQNVMNNSMINNIITTTDYEINKIQSSFQFCLSKPMKSIWTKISFDLIQSLKQQMNCYIKDVCKLQVKKMKKINNEETNKFEALYRQTVASFSYSNENFVKQNENNRRIDFNKILANTLQKNLNIKEISNNDSYNENSIASVKEIFVKQDPTKILNVIDRLQAELMEDVYQSPKRDPNQILHAKNRRTNLFDNISEIVTINKQPHSPNPMNYRKSEPCIANLQIQRVKMMNRPRSLSQKSLGVNLEKIRSENSIVDDSFLNNIENVLGQYKSVLKYKNDPELFTLVEYLQTSIKGQKSQDSQINSQYSKNEINSPKFDTMKNISVIKRFHEIGNLKWNED